MSEEFGIESVDSSIDSPKKEYQLTTHRINDRMHHIKINHDINDKLNEISKIKKEPSTPNFLFKKDNKFLDDSDGSDVSSDIETEWSDDIERILEEINYNCTIMSDYHKQVYLVLIGQLIYFRVPVIVL